MTPLAAWAPAGRRRSDLARRAAEAAGRQAGAAPVVVADEAALAHALAGPPGALLALDPGPHVHDALAAGWVVVSGARHLDARHGREVLWVPVQREEVLARTLADAAAQPALVASLRAAGQALAAATPRADFDARWAPPATSVVVPARDEPRVVEAVGSALDQTLGDLEVIVVDDGSTDDTRDRLLALDDPRLVLAWRGWGGPAAARNLGLALARGEAYVAFLDADDLWAPTLLERLVGALEAAPPAVGLAYCDARLEVEGEPPRPWSVPGVDLEALVASDGLLLTGSYVARRAAAEAAGAFDPELQRGEDHAWLLALAARRDLLHVPEPLLTVRRSARGQLATAPLDLPRLNAARARALAAGRRRTGRGASA